MAVDPLLRFVTTWVRLRSLLAPIYGLLGPCLACGGLLTLFTFVSRPWFSEEDNGGLIVVFLNAGFTAFYALLSTLVFLHVLPSPPPHLCRDRARTMPHLHRGLGWYHATSALWTGLVPCQIHTGTGLAPATSAPGLGSPRLHLNRGLGSLHRDWARPGATSAPGLWCKPCLPPNRTATPD